MKNINKSAKHMAARLFIILICLTFSFANCRSQSGKDAANNNGKATPVAQTGTDKGEVAGIPAPVPDKFNDVFVGKIDKYDINVELTREGENITGFYYYDNSRPQMLGVLNALSLSGTVSQDGSFTLKETETKADPSTGESNEKESGQWQGKLSAELINGDLRVKLTGTWSKPDKSKTSPFNIVQEKFNLGSAKIVPKETNEKNDKLKYEFKATYPFITGLTDAGLEEFNTKVDAIIKKSKR